jgi:chromosome segregation ATPase
MASVKEFDIIRDRITAYINNIRKLEDEMEKSAAECKRLSKALDVSVKEAGELREQKDMLIDEKTGLEESVKNLNAIVEKQKNDMDALEGRVNDLQNENHSLKEEIEKLLDTTS